MFISKVLQWFLAGAIVLSLTACGGGNGEGEVIINTAPVAEDKDITQWNINAITMPFSATDAEGDTLQFKVISQPAHGSISGNTYIPDANSRGEDSFTYVANDGKADSLPATVRIHIKAPFITTWKTDNRGSTSDTQIKIGTRPFHYSYNYTVDWGDGSKDENVTGSIIHTYDTVGIYTVKISGVFPRLWSKDEFVLVGSDDYELVEAYDSNKILSVEQWGDIAWKSMNSAFLVVKTW